MDRAAGRPSPLAPDLPFRNAGDFGESGPARTPVTSELARNHSSLTETSQNAASPAASSAAWVQRFHFTMSVMDNIPSIDDLYLAREVRGLGEQDRRYRDLVAIGKLVRIHRGAFAEKEAFDLRSPQMQYQMHCLGAFYSNRGPIVLSHESAAVMHAIPFLGRYPKVIHVLATMQAGTRTEHGYRKHATWHPDLNIERRGELVLTDLPRTLVELCSTTSFASAVAALDWAFREHGEQTTSGITARALVECADRLEIRRGRKQLMRAIEFADPLAESPGESLSRAIIHELGFPAPVLQQRFSDSRGFIGRVDFWWPEQNLIGEFDGIAKYIREEYARGKSPAQIVMDEKFREDRLRALGPGMTRWEWSIASNPQILFNQLHAAGLPTWRRSAFRSSAPRPKRASSA